MYKGAFPIRVYLIRQQREKMKSEMREISPNFKCIAYESKITMTTKKELGEEDQKSNVSFFYLKSKFLIAFVIIVETFSSIKFVKLVFLL